MISALQLKLPMELLLILTNRAREMYVGDYFVDISVKLHLRTPSEPDYPILLMWYGDANLPHLWNSHRRILTYWGFLEQLHQMMDVGHIRLVQLEGVSHPIGYCQCYNSNAIDGWAYLAVYLDSQHRDFAVVVEAVRQGLDMIFAAYPTVEKVYFETYKFAGYLDAGLRELGFVEEDVIPDQYWFRDRYWSRYRLAFYKDGKEEEAASELASAVESPSM